ncbi:MAG: hypothetical protein K0R08_2093 [Solimicrobium sp.]|jgi:hypothetical protein|nr:hypothetical protein [Solimicrobium sp.]
MKMKRLTTQLFFLFCLLPLGALAEPCQPVQGPISFYDNLYNSKPKWICPGGKLIISLNSEDSYRELKEYMTLAVRNGKQENVKIALKKFDPALNPQIRLNNTGLRKIHFEAVPGTIYFPRIITGDVTEGGHKRTITITNHSTYEICLSGESACPL